MDVEWSHRLNTYGVPRFAQEIVCAECASPELANASREDQIIQDDDINEGEETLYCDRCKEKL
jgi:hypothetical protein